MLDPFNVLGGLITEIRLLDLLMRQPYSTDSKEDLSKTEINQAEKGKKEIMRLSMLHI